jgi:hypothetical protein
MGQSFSPNQVKMVFIPGRSWGNHPSLLLPCLPLEHRRADCPAYIFSDLHIPRENMPAITNWYGDLLPVTQYLEITHGIILVGIATIQLW